MFQKLNPLTSTLLRVINVKRYNEISRTTTTKRATVNEKELKHFAQLAKVWWDPKFKLLHLLNDFRIPWIKNCLIQTGALKSTTEGTLLKGLSILDVGCGGGILTEPLARLDGNVTGLEPSEDVLYVAQNHANTQLFSNLRYECATIQEHAFQNKEKYDLVISSETIEHVTEKNEFVKYCVRCLKPGGSILLTTPNRTWPAKYFTIFLAENVFGAIPKGTHTYEMFIHLDDLTKMLENENCKIVSTSGLIFHPLTRRWFSIKSKTFHYAIHAIKKS